MFYHNYNLQISTVIIRKNRTQIGLNGCGVGRGGALVESMPFDRRVVGSNPALAETFGPWQVLRSRLPIAPRRVNSDTVPVVVVGSASERLML